VQYDKQFRLKKSRNLSSSWGVIDNELWLICMSQKRVVSTFTQNQSLSEKAENFRAKQETAERTIMIEGSEFADVVPHICCRYD
jgi:hypothetical protein